MSCFESQRSLKLNVEWRPPAPSMSLRSCFWTLVDKPPVLVRSGRRWRVPRGERVSSSELSSLLLARELRPEGLGSGACWAEEAEERERLLVCRRIDHCSGAFFAVTAWQHFEFRAGTTPQTIWNSYANVLARLGWRKNVDLIDSAIHFIHRIVN